MILLLTYLVLIFPMGLSGVHGGAPMSVLMPRTSTWRALATFMPTFTLGTVLSMVERGRGSALVLGLIAGLLVSCGTLWLLFHLNPAEVPVAAGYAGGMTAIWPLRLLPACSSGSMPFSAAP